MCNSWARTWPSVRRVAMRASRICPAWPLVAEMTIISDPAAAYFASVPPATNTSSSGWANTPRMRGAPVVVVSLLATIRLCLLVDKSFGELHKAVDISEVGGQADRNAHGAAAFAAGSPHRGHELFKRHALGLLVEADELRLADIQRL